MEPLPRELGPESSSFWLLPWTTEGSAYPYLSADSVAWDVRAPGDTSQAQICELPALPTCLRQG